jgi:ATP-dependent RNA helicase DDX1
VLQLVAEWRRREAEGKGQSSSSSSSGLGSGPSDWRMSGADKDPMMSVAPDGVTCQSSANRWVGGRATIGVTAGQVYYEVSVLDSGLGRVGWSTVGANYNLGTDKHGLGFGGTGMKSHAGKFDPYG